MMNSQQSQSSDHMRGKHRVLAELKRLDQETRFLEVRSDAKDGPAATQGERIVKTKSKLKNQASDGLLAEVRTETAVLEELEQLEKMDNASAACKELLGSVEEKPDPLLPETNGPVNPMWDCWFEGPRDSKGCRCWIL